MTHAIGLLQVGHGSALCEELGVGQNLKLNARVHAVAGEHLHGARGARACLSAVGGYTCRRMAADRGRAARAGTATHMEVHGALLPTKQLTFWMASAVLTGTVDFSTTILEDVAHEAIRRAAPSQ